jgi:hypothetical protein
MNPIALKFIQSSRSLMSIPSIFTLVLFTASLSSQLDVFTQPFCIVLGFAGVFAPNVILFTTNPKFTTSQGLLVASYIAIFRLFCLSHLELIWENQSWPSSGIFFGLGMFLIFLGMVDASASLDRTLHPRQKEFLSSELLLACLTAIYGMIITIWVWLAESRGTSKRKVCVFAGFVIADLIASIFSLFGMKWQQLKVVFEIIRVAIPTTCGAFILFLLRPSQGMEYELITKEELGEAINADEEILNESEDGFKEEEEKLEEHWE